MTDNAGSSAHQGLPRVLPSSPFLYDWALAHAAHAPDAPALATPAVALTYGQLGERVRAIAADLADAGIEPGARVLVALSNSPATVALGLALNLLGAVSLEVARDWAADVVGDIVERNSVRFLCLAGRDLDKWQAVLGRTRPEHLWVVHDTPLPTALREKVADRPVTRITPDGSLEADPPPAPAPIAPHELDQPALVLFTSGSLGRPLGVVQTFGNIDANTRAIAEYLELSADDRAMLTLPLHYCYGRSVLQTHLLVGGSVYLDQRMTFPRVILETMAAQACTGFAGVPLTFEVIRRQVDVATIPLPQLRYLTQAGGHMADEMIEWVRRAFAPARLFVMYGQTEATARLSYLPPEDGTRKPGSIGIAVPGVELRVVDGSGREVPAGTIGEIVARGGNVTPGYLDDAAATAAILRDGWLWTGDLGERDEEGYLYHRGRAREILKVGGHRVSPADIEQVVARHEAVAEVVVIGRPHDLLGEVPVAVVVATPGSTVNEQDLRRHCQAALAPRQVPASFIAVTSLPRNAAGKPLRAEIARMYGVAASR